MRSRERKTASIASRSAEVKAAERAAARSAEALIRAQQIVDKAARRAARVRRTLIALNRRSKKPSAVALLRSCCTQVLGSYSLCCGHLECSALRSRALFRTRHQRGGAHRRPSCRIEARSEAARASDMASVKRRPRRRSGAPTAEGARRSPTLPPRDKQAKPWRRVRQLRCRLLRPLGIFVGGGTEPSRPRIGDQAQVSRSIPMSVVHSQRLGTELPATCSDNFQAWRQPQGSPSVESWLWLSAAGICMPLPPIQASIKSLAGQSDD
eukprot:2818902-Pleurochrysis_carterae.AAC.2